MRPKPLASYQHIVELDAFDFILLLIVQLVLVWLAFG